MITTICSTVQFMIMLQDLRCPMPGLSSPHTAAACHRHPALHISDLRSPVWQQDALRFILHAASIMRYCAHQHVLGLALLMNVQSAGR